MPSRLDSHWKLVWHEHGFDDAVYNCSNLLYVNPARFIIMITRTSSMDASWRVGVWPRSLFTTLSARIPHLHPTKAPHGNRNLSDTEPLSPIPLRPLHSNSLAQYISYTGGMCTWMLRSELHHQQRCTSMRLKNRPVRSKRRNPCRQQM